MLTSEKAAELLGDVKESNSFRLHMGTSLKNLGQLAEALDIMADATFNHHVNGSKNDFAAWIRHSIGDNELAEQISGVKDRRKIVSLVKRRAEYLEKKSIEDKLSGREFLTCGVTDFVLGAVIGFVIGMIVAVIM